MSYPFCRFKRFALLLLPALFCSCEKEGPYRKETFPVTALVYVDDKLPTSDIKAECHSVAGMDTQHPTVSQGYVGGDGKLAISTYESGDGVPPGEYVLTFYWGEHNLLSRSYGGPDKLKDKYRDPKTSPFKFTVEPGKPTDLGRIDLTTK